MSKITDSSSIRFNNTGSKQSLKTNDEQNDNTNSINNDNIEMGTLDKRTRFQVNKVHSASSPQGDSDSNRRGEQGSSNSSQRDTLIDIATEENDEFEDGVEDDGFKASETSPLNCDTAASYDTKYGKSFRHFTREALPRLDNYRNIMSIQAAYRPTLDELHHPSITTKPISQQNVQAKDGAEDTNTGEVSGQIKFGWVQGVLIRCLLNIWGVMLFLRLSWVVAQAGIGESIILILTTTVVTTITALSMSAISTNGVIKGGGTYYMISRSLGPEFGGSIGLIFSLANAVACAMYVVGFCESMNDLLRSFGVSIIDGKVQDVRIIGSITIVILLIIVVVGMEWETKAQIGLLVILLLAVLDFMIGTFLGPQSEEAMAKGFLGYNMTLLKENFFSDYREAEGVEHNFFSVFAIFFPAATGILAGANISGDLKDPQSSIPKGTILAILITSLSYILMAIMAGWTVARDATGNVDDLINGTFLNCTGIKCEYGLHNNFQVIELVAIVGPIIYAGCFAATLSSALASLVSAPKVFQALCRDKLYPHIEWFAKGYGANSEPVRGYILTFFLAIGFILIGELNLIAPLISNFFLAAYTLINFSTFHASLAKPVGWRPTFKYYNMWLSLLGSVLCVVVMFLISWVTALITLSTVLALYLIVQYRKPAVNWGSTTQAQTYKNALNAVHQLNSVEDHVKNYRPQILVLSGMPGTRPPLMDFAYLLTKNLSMLVCGHISKDPVSYRIRSHLTSKANNWLKSHKIKAFYTFVDDSTFEEGAKALMQATGVGKLRPNILMTGYKSDWKKCPLDELNMYFEVMHKALDMHLAVCILRLQEGLDYSRVLGGGTEDTANTSVAGTGNGNQTQTNIDPTRSRRNSTDSLIKDNNYGQISQASSASDISMPTTPHARLRNNVNACPNPEDGNRTNAIVKSKEKLKESSNKDEYKGPGGAELPKDTLNNLCQFQRKQKKMTIDVWWLYDDGGLTLLLPYIISTRHTWSGCRLRVFALANKQAELECEQRNMASLLAKFRIDYSDLQIIPDITRKPHDNTRAFFDSLIAEFKVPLVDGDPDSAPLSEADLLAMKDKTNRHLRLRELLLQHSHDAGLVVMTLPMPKKNIVSAPLYLAWLEVLTRDMPPFLLVRGNHTSVLTFYS